jgi:uncharacterized protein with von Willebrand factor type A (vWA) domain
MLNDYDVLLQPVFQEMRRAGAELSLSEYLLAIETLRAGIGLENADRVAQVCRLLWTKSREEQEIFDLVFAAKAAPLLKIMTSPVTLEEKLEPGSDVEAFMSEEDEEELEAADYPEDDEEEEIEQESEHFIFQTPTATSTLDMAPQSKRIFHFIPRLPLSKKEMVEHWQQLLRFRPAGPVKEIDIEQTINDICRNGQFRGPVMRPRAGNASRLLVLIDQGGSMAPFKLLIQALKESIEQSDMAEQTAIYYFHNYPTSALYTDERLGMPMPGELVLAHHARRSGVLIVSDAGAARAHYDTERLRKTTDFLVLLRQYTYLYAWLNPVLPYRWSRTTAEDIESLVPMYPLDRDGLDDAITILRGQPFPAEVRLYG